MQLSAVLLEALLLYYNVSFLRKMNNVKKKVHQFKNEERSFHSKIIYFYLMPQ